jgi:hypothetical protein
MNYYAKLYNDDYEPNNIKVHMSIVEAHLTQTARVIGDLNITENSFCKYVKQPYDIIEKGEYTITLKKLGEATYTLLSHLLTLERYTHERITQISSAIHAISNNTSIKTNQNCCGDWINIS